MTDSQATTRFPHDTSLQVEEVLIKALPVLEPLVALGRILAQRNAEQSICNTCPRQGPCSSSCEKMDRLLPGPSRGKGHRECWSGFDADSLEQLTRIRLSEVFERYESCKEVFTRQQWFVLHLYYREGLTQMQIAERIGKSRSTVQGLLDRAQKRKAAHDKAMRKEMFEQMKKSDET